MQPLTQLTENPLSPDKQKNTEDFGLRVIRSCYNRWKNGYGGETYVNRIARMSKNRLYAMGKQPMEQFRDMVKIEGMPVVINLDYSPLAVAVPLLNAKIDRYLQREERIKCKAFGPISQNKKKKDKDEAKYKMNYRVAIQDLQAKSGLQLEQFSDEDPTSELELNIKFKTTYKQKEEIIMEQAMRLVFEQNEWQDVIKPRLLMDVFCAGYSITKTELDGNGWIKTPWVSPESFITSYSEYDDFRDWQWQGQRLSVSITEIRLRYPGKFSEQELWSLANRFKGKYGNATEWYCEWSDYFNTAAARPYDAVNVEIVDLYYKTLYNLEYTEVTNKYGKTNLIAPDKVKPNNPQVTGKEKSPPYYVAYHGVWIIDTDHVLEWGLAKDMLKPNSNLVEIRSPYTVHMYANNKCRNTPLVETMIPLIDIMQNIHLQALRIIAVTAPDGFNIDLLGLSNIDMGEGVGIISPMQAWGIYLQTGNQYFMSKTEGGEDVKPPIQPQNNQFSNKLEQLDGQWWSAYKKLQIITGDNNLAQGNITNQDVANKTLETATELAESPSNYAYRSYLMNYKGTAKNVELLLLDKFFLKDDSFSGYTKALGEEDVKYMRNMASEGLEMLMFDTDIKVTNDDAEKARLDKFIEIALQKEQITPADVARLDMVEDQTYRAFLLAQAVQEKRDADAKIAQQNSQNNVMQNKAAADAKGQHDIALEQLAHKNKMELQQSELEAKTTMKAMEGNTALEGKIIDSILSNPEAKLSDIPEFIWKKLGITDANTQQLILSSMQKQAQMQQQQAMAQQQAQQQQRQQQGQGQPQQQVAA